MVVTVVCVNKINNQQWNPRATFYSTNIYRTFIYCSFPLALHPSRSSLTISCGCAAHSHAIRAQPLALQRAQTRGQPHERGGAVRMRRLLGGQGHVAARVGRAQSAQFGVVDLG